MTSRSQYSSNEIHALLHEQLEAMLSECDNAMNNAAYGQTINNLIPFCSSKGESLSAKFFGKNSKNAFDTSKPKKKRNSVPSAKKKRPTDINVRKPSSRLMTIFPLSAPTVVVLPANTPSFQSTQLSVLTRLTLTN